MTEFECYQEKIIQCEQEIGKGIIGQKEVIRQVMLAMLAGGNVLLEGMPGPLLPEPRPAQVVAQGPTFAHRARLQPAQ